MLFAAKKANTAMFSKGQIAKRHSLSERRAIAEGGEMGFHLDDRWIGLFTSSFSDHF